MSWGDPTKKENRFYIEADEEDASPTPAYSLHKMANNPKYELVEGEVGEERVVLQSTESGDRREFEHLGQSIDIDWDEYDVNWEQYGGRPEWA